MSAGYVYVLVNSSMPGLVKVGKTTRLPSERVSELSGVTGVATPFVVAFEQYFLDCNAAEDFVHAELERRGLRQASNREFFRASTNEVVRVVLQAPGLADGPQPDSSRAHVMSNGVVIYSKPWEDVFQAADDHYYGLGDVIQDYQEALELYTDAMRLGSPVAYQRIGDMYRYGEGVSEDIEKALRYYKDGAAKGNCFCYAAMAEVFLDIGQFDNARKSWRHFFGLRQESAPEDIDEWFGQFPQKCGDYIRLCFKHNLHVEFADELRAEGNVIRYGIVRFLRERSNDKGWPEQYRKLNASALDWAVKNLSDGIDQSRKSGEAEKTSERPEKSFVGHIRDWFSSR